MAPADVPWTRLVRFVGVGDKDIKYGEPIADSSSNIAELAKNGKLKVRVCEGDNPFLATPTETIATVKLLLGPLRPSDVPIIRCIGLNYKTHSNSLVFLKKPQD
jgi:hypothetical protein